ncbi:4-alpha-glucanotransferase [Porphyromonas uenonis 60-3]|uniref:4-alpha-glucanotransferase n=1 Tax=Porphyromonas uenonis 60-3 TaxID=596327 RepID=C2MD00_9PORP|nr:4-alpha-glucanotransferase [Porphyromonas uenonis]EEK16354.1 4-alpha-glucanotransferase [Porphyromonas uenonis 60-3]
MSQIPRQTGIAVPLFSLRRQGDAGCGDFAALEAFAPVAERMGVRIIQLLPLEDTTLYGDSRDSYPYGPLASTALNPIYIAVDQLPPLADQQLEQELRAEAQSLSAQKTFDYTAVWQLKRRWLWASFTEQADASPYFTDMINRYARLTRKHAPFKSTPIWHYWVCERMILDLLPDLNREEWDFWEAMERVNKLEQENKALVVRTGNFYAYCYMVAQRQMRRAVATIRQHGLSLMGDLPVGVDPHAADTLAYPGKFNKRLFCGAPPDYFSPDGQNWGILTCRRNWKMLWQERFGYLERFYDYLRVDHVLGFFRMWSIPRDGRSGMLGYFLPSRRYLKREIAKLGLAETLRPEWIAPSKKPVTTQEVFWIERLDAGYVPRYDVASAAPFAMLSPDLQERMRAVCEDYYYGGNEKLWRERGLERLTFLKDLTSIHLCAEDLGMVPQCVYPVLEELGILKLYVERMPKSAGIEFEAAPYFSEDSVATTSTHDCAPLRLWWAEDEARSRRYYDYFLADYGVPYDTTLTPELAEIIVRRHLESPSRLCILPLQDWLALSPEHCATVDPQSEQINDPSNPHHVWSYRMPIAVEELPDDWIRQLRQMIAETHRL